MIKIKVIGVGGAGVNTVSRIKAKKIPRVLLTAVNTDAQSLAGSVVEEKIQIGSALTKGCGSGGNSEIGRMAANESRQELAKALEGIDLVFIVAGLGGGTGTGAGPTIARLAKEAGITVMGVVTTPFLFEGQKRMAEALEGLSILENEADTVVVIPNQRLFSMGQDSGSLQDAFERGDGFLIKIIASITDLITMPGLINLDFSNLKAILTKGGRGFFGCAECAGADMEENLVEGAFNSILLEDAEIKSASSCLVNIYGSEKLTFKEVNNIMEIVSGKFTPGANIAFGVTLDKKLGDIVRMTVIATGIKVQPSRLSKVQGLKSKEPAKWPDIFDYTEELDIPAFLRKK